jgi:DNA processing protein
MNDGTKCWVTLHRIPGIGRVRVQSAESALRVGRRGWTTTRADLSASGLDSKTVDAIVEGRPRCVPGAGGGAAPEAGVQVLTIADPCYPSRLREICDAPFLLYVMREMLREDEMAITVVGMRRVAGYGREVTQRFATELSRRKSTGLPPSLCGNGAANRDPGSGRGRLAPGD